MFGNAMGEDVAKINSFLKADIMSKKAQTLVSKLEARVEELRQALTQAQHQVQQQAVQLEVSTQISQLASSILDPNTLCRRFAKIIKDQFRLYHVGVYLIDESRQWAVFFEAAGKASRKRKKESYRLPLSGNSTVAWVSKTQKLYLVSPTQRNRGNGQTSVQVDGLLLPEANSEMALPLITNNRLIGVVDVQCVQKNAFDESTIRTLKALTDQIAPAIERAQLHTATVAERDRTNLLFEISAALNANLEFDSVATIAVGLADRLGAASGEITC